VSFLTTVKLFHTFAPGEPSGPPAAIDKQLNEVAIRVPEEQVRSHGSRTFSDDLTSRLSDRIPGVTEYVLADDEAEMNAVMVPRVCVDPNIRLSLERQLLTSCGCREEDDVIGLQSRRHGEESLVKRTRLLQVTHRNREVEG
jgi:hypothetical protein